MKYYQVPSNEQTGSACATSILNSFLEGLAAWKHVRFWPTPLFISYLCSKRNKKDG